MTGKQQTVGWLGLFLVLANMMDGALRDSLHVLGKSGSSGGGGFGGGLIPNIPLVPQGPVTGIPFSPVSMSNPHGLPPKPNHPAQPAPVLSA